MVEFLGFGLMNSQCLRLTRVADLIGFAQSYQSYRINGENRRESSIGLSYGYGSSIKDEVEFFIYK
jgi:hypothetical protein